MDKKTAFGTMLAEKYGRLIRNKDRSTQIDANTPTGGISIKRGLLPAAQVGQTITLEVTAVDDKSVHCRIIK